MSPDSGNTLRYVTNGATGNNGACGANGNFGGYRGQDGAPGKCGQNAHALKVAIVSYNNIIFVQGNETSNELNISDRTVTISVEARGGDAGNGGNGGDGGKGVTGPKGKTPPDIGGVKTEVKAAPEAMVAMAHGVAMVAMAVK
ncbi:hypothetical protein [Endozoicomonas sp. GU-1]|uniref:hypothetical protein n=1 Tax=Endozoicomonas sp. GU-1 TaxID=3009078 RepID=UPI0022B43E4E|nr:hypothetical protein [Endozoicomonas sp. GU-1]WBA83820.1 hypothetical protein O2T12_12220 [Endozoicomonas sp. GU-1]